MKFIHNTISLCNECYRHIPGIVYEDDEKIWITKQCEHHGEQQELVEIDTEFYYSINKKNKETKFEKMFALKNILVLTKYSILFFIFTSILNYNP
jgi:uncharacterized radical SAM superfamily Fe-S cluster-containing enzyme